MNGRRVRRRWPAVLIVLACCVVIAGVVTVFVQVHAATADWWPRAIPTRVQYDDRDFTCGDDPRRDDVGPDALKGLEPRGRTIGGGVIYAPGGFDLPDGIVVSADGELRACPLSGGT
ncbi:hypothetical protein GCM10009820_07080 [Leifsonia soli]